MPHVKARIVRDLRRRQGVASTELMRRAYLYLARNTQLPLKVCSPWSQSIRIRRV